MRQTPELNGSEPLQSRKRFELGHCNTVESRVVAQGIELTRISYCRKRSGRARYYAIQIEHGLEIIQTARTL
jgi:hypothetical protein